MTEALNVNNGFQVGEIFTKMSELDEIIHNKSIKEQEYQKSVSKTEQIKNEKNELEKTLEEKKKALADKENELNEKYPELKELLTTAQEAQKAYEQGKVSAASDKQNEITKTKQNIKDINVEITKRDNEEKLKEQEKEQSNQENKVENPFVLNPQITNDITGYNFINSTKYNVA